MTAAPELSLPEWTVLTVVAQAVPERDATAEHDRHQHDVQVVDQVSAQELVDVVGLPPSRTSRSPAACWACRRTSAGAPEMK